MEPLTAPHHLVSSWEPEVARLLDERHLAAWSDSSGTRQVFGGRLAAFLQGIDDTEVVRLFGRAIRSLDELCEQLEAAIPIGPGDVNRMRRRVTGPAGVVARLRHRHEFIGRDPVRRRYVLWQDADVLIEHDRVLFGAVIDAIAGVAAENEYTSDDSLLLTRAVCVGGPALAAYAHDDAGQLRRWRGACDGSGALAVPFWELVSGIAKPPVFADAIESILSDPEGLATAALLDDVALLEAAEM
ncbi:MAG: hypothetical protein AAGB48_03955 [Planctomycetota bacterium]